MLSTKVQEALQNIAGWCNEEKAELFSYYLKPSPCPKLCVEIGVFGGRSLVVLGLLLKELGEGSGVVLGIDNWPKDAIAEGNDEKDMDWYLSKDLEPIYQGCLSHIRRYEIESHCAVLRLSSENASFVFPDSSIDLIHIDGNHSEKVSCRDVDIYLPKVKSGGIVVFDDINWGTTLRAQGKVEEVCVLEYKSSHFAAYRKL